MWRRAPGGARREAVSGSGRSFARGSAVVVPAAAADEARAAVDGSSLRRVERDGRRLAALRALDGDLDALAHARRLRVGDGREALVLRLLARLAALRLVLQTLVVEEELLARRPDEFLAAVHAHDRAILELHLGLLPLRVGLRRGNLRCLNL